MQNQATPFLPQVIKSLAALLVFALATPANAQSLDSQYQFYLGNRCSQMGFARTVILDIVVPGQASEELAGFCSALIPLGGGSTTIGGGANGAGSAVGGANGSDNPAINRRREAARTKDEAGSKSTVVDGSLPLTANISAYISGDYQHQQQDDTEFSGGRDANLAAMTLGADYRLGSSGLVGVAVRGERVGGDYTAGGDFDTAEMDVTLYASWYPFAATFVDFSLVAARKKMESQRLVMLSRQRRNNSTGIEFTVIDIPEAPADSDVSSSEYGGELRGGYDFYLGRFAVGPRIGARYRRSTTDSYVEQGETIMTLAFDKQNDDSLRSMAGLQASAAMQWGGVVIVPQINGDWVHEFRNDQRYITARFVQDFRPDATQLRFQNDAPDRDVYLARFSLVAVFQGGLSAFLTGEQMFGHDYQQQYGGSLGLRLEF